jgi:hypothetical protein
VSILGRIIGRFRCWLGDHDWESPREPADRAIATLLGYAACCRRCGTERDEERPR